MVYNLLDNQQYLIKVLLYLFVSKKDVINRIKDSVRYFRNLNKHSVMLITKHYVVLLADKHVFFLFYPRAVKLLTPSHLLDYMNNTTLVATCILFILMNLIYQILILYICILMTL